LPFKLRSQPSASKQAASKQAVFPPRTKLQEPKSSGLLLKLHKKTEKNPVPCTGKRHQKMISFLSEIQQYRGWLGYQYNHGRLIGFLEMSSSLVPVNNNFSLFLLPSSIYFKLGKQKTRHARRSIIDVFFVFIASQKKLIF
jgi:hypothetical protein